MVAGLMKKPREKVKVKFPCDVDFTKIIPKQQKEKFFIFISNTQKNRLHLFHWIYRISKMKVMCEIVSISNCLFEGDKHIHEARLVGSRDVIPIYRYSINRFSILFSCLQIKQFMWICWSDSEAYQNGRTSQVISFFFHFLLKKLQNLPKQFHPHS